MDVHDGGRRFSYRDVGYRVLIPIFFEIDAFEIDMFEN